MASQAEIARSPSGEVPFAISELFYSRTDPRGVILAGNEIFRRVSGYDWAELLGAPHRLVRHPDTPRGVFRILWEALGKGNPMAAYVKNRAKSGQYYWVFAVMLPIAGGFLSVRLKPTAPLFTRIREIYDDLIARERDGLDPEASARWLHDVAQAQGFSSYTSFMASALGQELAARDARLERAADARTRVLTEMNEALEETTREQGRLLRSFDALQSIPNNMRIVASRMEPTGGPISAISENYKISSQAISVRLHGFAGARDSLIDRVSRDVAKALFLLGCGRLLGEMNASFLAAAPVPGIDWEVERALLLGLERDCARDGREAMLHAVEHSATLNRASAEVRRHMLGLDTIRVLGRVECGRMRDANGGLAATIDQLDAFHAEIKGRLETIMRLSENVGLAMDRYLRSSAATVV